MKSNFEFLSKYWEDAASLGKAAELVLSINPSKCAKILGKIGEFITTETAFLENIPLSDTLSFGEKTGIIRRILHLPRIIDDILYSLYKTKKDLLHDSEPDTTYISSLLQLTYHLTVWFMQVYGDQKFQPEPYQEPDNAPLTSADMEFLQKHDILLSPWKLNPVPVKTDALKVSRDERIAVSQKSAEAIMLSDKEISCLQRSAIRLDISVADKVNYGYLQNGYSLIHSLSVVNNSPSSLNNLTLTITSNPKISRTFSYHIDSLLPNTVFEVKNLNLEIDTEYFRSNKLQEGSLVFELKSEETVLFQDECSIQLLEINHWQGLAVYPELLAGFILPGCDAVKDIGNQAKIYLQTWTGDAALDGYERQNTDRVEKQAAAVYAALLESEISCSALVGDFATNGVTVKFPEEIVRTRSGTALDLALLYASVLESARLNPVIVIASQQIFTGVWLTDTALPETVDDDPSVLLADGVDGEKKLLLVDPTGFSSGLSFEEACNRAESALRKESVVDCILDVKRSRETVMPLPSGGSRVIVAEKNLKEVLPVKSKIALWESKLLDLGLGNTLINMRMTKSILPILPPKLEILEDELDRGIEFLIKPLPPEKISGQITLESLQNISGFSDLIEEGFVKKSIYSLCTEDELKSKLKTIYRKARLSIEENGANTLYLAIGILKWFETEKSEKARYAPLALIPVDLVRKYASNGYVIRIREEDSQINVTLLEKLKQEFHLDVDAITAIPGDAYGLDIQKIFAALRMAVQPMKRWDVLESTCLGIFSFNQFVMWNDLHTRSDELLNNKLTHSFISGKLEWHAEPMTIDRRVPEDDVYLPIPADSSQLYAIDAACSGKSFVLHGPPGTGKSQTITSMIANALAHGKRVLFVAEKMAALEVVQKRLDKIGISPFCLELHSNKTKKRDVLDKLKDVTEIANPGYATKYEETVAECRKIKAELDAYATSLHRNRWCGESLYTLINQYESASASPDICTFDSAFAYSVTPSVLSGLDSEVEHLVAAGKMVGHPHNHPLSFVKTLQYPQSVRYVMQEKLHTYSQSLTAFQDTVELVSSVLQTAVPGSKEEIASFVTEVGNINYLADLYELPLETTYPISNCTLAELLDQEEAFSSIPDRITLPEGFVRNATAADLQNVEDYVAGIIEKARAVDSPVAHPLSFVTVTEPVREEDVANLVQEYADVLQELADGYHLLTESFGLSGNTAFHALEEAAAQFSCLVKWQKYPELWADAENQEEYLAGVIKLADDSLAMEEHMGELRRSWTDEFFIQNVLELSVEVTEINQKHGLGRSLALNSLHKRLKPFMREQVEKDMLCGSIESLKEYFWKKDEVQEEFEKFGTGIDSKDWHAVKRSALEALDLIKEMQQIMDVDRVRKTAGNIREYDWAISNFMNNWNRTLQLKESVSTLLGIEDTDGFNWISLQLSMCSVLKENLNQLNAWIEWNQTAQEAYGYQLGSIIAAYNAGCTHEDILPSYRKSICSATIEEIVLSETEGKVEKPAGELVHGLHEFYNLLKSVSLEEGTRVGDITASLLEAWDIVEKAKDALYELLDIAEQDTESWVSGEQQRCTVLETHFDELKEWIIWNSVSAEAVNAGLEPVVQAYVRGVVHNDVVGGFRKALYRALSIAVIDSDEVLGKFSGSLFDEKVAQFRRLDETLSEITQKEIYAMLALRIPDFSKEAAESSEINILQRAIRSGGRGVSIRKLFGQIQNLLPRMCPCMLMSPISVAQYLTAEHELFDLVIFDEASQLPTWKALGTLLRGKEAVIVGDSNQMPPTSFFASESIDEEYADINDLDSILDDCLALNMPSTHLLWHYRSRHESLIAFSNRKFYENKLYTFPSADERSSHVRLVHVDGFFERGRKRVNTSEAKAIVDELIRRCYNPVLARQSVGVVTFNVNQQSVIEDMIDDICLKDTKFEEWAFHSAEPLFVKNLENVQGDERDVILFSVGYGPDKDGKFSMNFGPLNRDGGWRRLNVAITRARSEMVIFSTLRPENINLSRTRSEGVAALKSFLEYADGDQLRVAENLAGIRDVRHLEIVQSIASVLKENGYDSEVLVGHSRYRVSLGVIDPKSPGKYLLGILLDDEEYGSAKTTRDRELSQITVLQGLGWHVLRVWTMDWWDNRRKEIQHILDTLQAIEENAPVEEEMPEIAEPETVVEPVSAETETVTEESGMQKLDYTVAELEPDVYKTEDFVKEENRDRITAKVLAVIHAEAPITESLLNKRIIQSCGITRSSPKIQKVLHSIYEGSLYVTMEGETKIYWADENRAKTFASFRTGTTAESKRDAKDIPVVEAANAVVYAVRQSVSLTDAGLVKEGAKMLGYSRLGQALTALMEEAVRHAVETGMIIQSGNGNWILSS